VKGDNDFVKCTFCTQVWHPHCIDTAEKGKNEMEQVVVESKDFHVCPDCTTEQAEASLEAKRWAEYLKTNTRLPNLSSKLPLKNNAHVLGHEYKIKEDRSDSWCTRCDNGGDVICCSYCPRVWHLECIESKEQQTSAQGKGKWPCPKCRHKFATKKKRHAEKPEKPKVVNVTQKITNGRSSNRPAAKRRRVVTSNSGLLDTVPSNLTFNQQIKLALVQSQRDAIRQERRARATLVATPSPAIHKEVDSSYTMESGTSSSESESLSLPASPPMPPSQVILPVLASEPKATCQSIVDDFVIQEATDMIELEGFQIMASSEAT